MDGVLPKLKSEQDAVVVVIHAENVKSSQLESAIGLEFTRRKKVLPLKDCDCSEYRIGADLEGNGVGLLDVGFAVGVRVEGDTVKGTAVGPLGLLVGLGVGGTVFDWVGLAVGPGLGATDGRNVGFDTGVPVGV